MAEAATVIQLVQFSAAVLGFCYAYIQKAKSAPTEITAIIDETTSLKTVLEQLQTIANNPNDERFVILKSLSRPNGPFAIATSALADLDARMKAMTELSGLKKRLQWPIEARGVEKILERIAALKTDFYLALAGDVGLEVDRIQDAVGDVKVSLEDMKAAEEKRKIIDWIAGPDPAVLYNSAKAKRQPGTCEWLLKSEDFQNWFCKGGQLMWLHGLPGAGKTFLSSATIEHLLEQPLSTEYTIVYYYFDFRDTIRQTCSGLLRSLAHQICSQAKSTPELLLKLHEECRGSTPSNEQLLEALQGLLQLAFRTFVIIDALDECPGSEDGERGDVLDVLKQLKTLEAHNLSIFVASRPEADIKEKMKDICDFDTDIQSASVDEDIRQYVRSCLSNKSDKLNRWPQNIKDEIEEKLMQKAGGMFRWAACQLGELRKCLKPARVRAELDNLPKTLDETYARILANVPDMYHAELRTALIFLTFSTRPMTVQEVAEATAINIQEHSFSTEDRFGHPYDLLEVCSSLVSLSELPTDANSPFYKEGYIYSQRLYNKKDIRILQFAHFSVKEYLLAERTQKTILDVFIINEALSHSQITAACLTYLLDFNGGERLVNRDFEEFPLLPYSALHWSAHLALSKATESAAIDPLLLKLFDPAENHLLNLLNLYNPQHWQKELAMGATRRSTMDFRPPLYYASFYGLVPVVESLLQTLTNDDVRLDVLNSSLAGAATGGHANIIEMLLVAGADPNASLCGDVLCNAAKAGSPSAVKSLIQAGASKHASESYEGDALHAACVEGQPEVVHLLLDYGFDIHKRCQRYGVPLSAALRRDNEALVKLLIEKGANVNFPVEGYWNPLAIAAEHSSLALVKYLLSAGATIGPKTNPLAEAAKRGDLEMVKLLLRHGADINYASDGFYGTALKGAIQSRNSELLDFVLQAGADIDQRGGSEMYPVDMAIYAGSIAAAEKLLDLGAAFSDCAMEEALDSSQKYHLVKILLLQGADANAEHERYGSILQYAIVKSSDELILELLNAGADANGVLGEEGGTPLVMAAYNGNSTLAHLLLERGALINPETLSGSYGDPLCAAIQNENEALIDLFLDKGAGLGRTGDKYDPPLHCAAKRGDIVTVRKLIGRGADVNHVSGRYATALRAALAFGHNEVANYLLNNGADPNIIVKGKHSTLFYQHSSEEFDHAFEVAVATNNTSTVQVLLNSGFDLNSSEQAAVRALKYSLMMLEATMLEYLVAKGIDVAKFGGKSMNVNRWSKDSEVLKKIKLMLSKGAILPKGNEGLGNTLLLTSIDRQEWELLDFLLDAGCDPNITYDGGNLQGSPLNEAVKGEHMDAITKLLAKGANVNLHAGMWGTPFVNAIAKGDEELYRLFLEHGAAINSPPSGAFGSPLDVAISKGYYDFAHDLIDRGADVHGASSYGSLLTPACHGGSVGQMAMVRRLLTLGVDVNAEDARRPGDNSNRLYQTPFQAAIRSKNDELLKLLLEHGAKINPDEPQGSYGYPLQTAVRYAYEDQTRLLLEHGADVNAIGGEYGTALQAAAAESSDALIKLLLESGADVTIEGGYYGSALQAACRRGIVRHVKLFLEKGAPVNTNCGKYGSPLAAAAKRAEKEVVEILLDAGADVNQTGGKYGTPLQAACCAKGSTAKRHGEDTIKLLLERGAKVNTQDVGKYGSPIQAAAFHNKGYTKILLAHGAAVFVEGGKYRTAAKAAHAAKAFHTEKLLMEHGKA